MAEYILRFEDPNARKIELTGGKGSSLAYLRSIERTSIPEGFCVSTIAYDEFLTRAGLDEKIRKFDRQLSRLDKNQVDQRAANLRGDFVRQKVPQDIEESIKQAYKSLCKELGYEVEVAIRSSATAEDLENASFAGQHDTYLNVKGEDNVVDAIKKCWTSFYTDRAINYRKESGFPQYGKNLKMSVVVQRMINPQAAGVAFSIDQTTAYDGVVIEANYGLGESLVSGNIIPDRFVVHKQTLAVIKAQKGSKQRKIVYKDNGGTIEVDVPLEERQKYAVSFDLIREIAKAVNRIQQAYDKRTRFVDTEFAIDQNSRLYFLQSRPATLDLKVVTVKEEAANSARKILEGGTKATRKAAHGAIKIIPNFQALKDGEVNVEPDDIVVTYHTWNEWTEYLRGMRGIVTTQGGTLSHAAIISREWKIAGIVGCEDAIERLKEYEGEAVTIDANRRSVYLGRLPLEERIADPKEESVEVQQAEEKRIKPIEHLIQDEEGEWLGRPNYSLGRLQLEIYWNAFDRLDQWLELRPTQKKIKDGVIYTLFGKEDLGKKLDPLSVGELEQIYMKWVDTERDFLQASETFEVNEQSFKRFINLYTWMNTFMDMAFAFNTHLERRLGKTAQEKRMPQTFYDESLAFLEGIVEHEDTKRELEAVELGKAILPYYKKGKDLMQMFREIEEQDHRLSGRIVTYSKSYRFGRSDFRNDSPIKRVMQRLAETIGMDLNPPQEYAEPKDIVYFPEDPEFQKLLELAVKCKIQANNFHHTKARGQWKFRDAMLGLGSKIPEKGVLSNPLEIFERSIDEVSELVRIY